MAENALVLKFELSTHTLRRVVNFLLVLVLVYALVFGTLLLFEDELACTQTVTIGEWVARNTDNQTLVVYAYDQDGTLPDDPIEVHDEEFYMSPSNRPGRLVVVSIRTGILTGRTFSEKVVLLDY